VRSSSLSVCLRSMLQTCALMGVGIFEQLRAHRVSELWDTRMNPAQIVKGAHLFRPLWLGVSWACLAGCWSGNATLWRTAAAVVGAMGAPRLAVVCNVECSCPSTPSWRFALHCNAPVGRDA
jgi:hypothetical protein